MRIRINGDIISKTKKDLTNYKHSTYSAILNILNDSTSNKIHDLSKKQIKLFSFSNIYIENNKFHFYITGNDDFVNEIINNLSENQIFKLADMILAVKNIELCKELKKKSKYLFKGNIIAKVSINGKNVLLKEDLDIENRLKKIALKKLKLLNVDGDISFEIINKTINISRYKDNLHIPSYKCMLLVKGDYEAIKTIYEVGIGENTATGHGLLWEV